jgi:hypothetical protein
LPTNFWIKGDWVYNQGDVRRLRNFQQGKGRRLKYEQEN